MLKVLFISQWYPNRNDSMFGLFIQKHAEAVAYYCDVKVLYVHPDDTIKKFEFSEKKQANISEIIIYSPYDKNKFYYKITKVVNYLRAYYIGYKKILNDGFKPDIVHANILTRTVLIAYFLKKIHKTPYIVTEHWSRYLDGRNAFQGFFRKLLTRLVVKNAKAILPVSENLKNAMLKHHLMNSNYIVVNNVVDNSFFIPPVLTTRSIKRILHISCFENRAKNISGLIRATKQLSTKRQDFELILIGAGVDFKEICDLAETLNFPKGMIQFVGEKTPAEVANYLHNSDFFVLFSNYENSPVVISESLVCGKPVLSSNVGGISEHINTKNGILVDAGDEDNLLQQMDYLLDNFRNYNAKEIMDEAKQKFSYNAVGKTLNTIYNQSLQ